eukprot:1136473-Pelagomonas_calceolata.AAC.2
MRALYAEMWEWRQVASITRPEHEGVLKVPHGCVLHHQVAGRGRSFLPSKAKTRFLILPHCNNLTFKTLTIKLLDNVGVGFGSI